MMRKPDSKSFKKGSKYEWMRNNLGSGNSLSSGENYLLMMSNVQNYKCAEGEQSYELKFEDMEETRYVESDQYDVCGLETFMCKPIATDLFACVNQSAAST
ncbi:hypothetical protein RF11_05452 [Thelohanellus kitauei]|uniref:Uncharacterized protein n=1 Tax=Thelohanellus kitauei TaxID=669202 RepID=A0A0C2IS06_THEKT|nr:hypothetical protein RF11_05452 [Thelohanellus kitauei]